MLYILSNIPVLDFEELLLIFTGVVFSTFFPTEFPVNKKKLHHWKLLNILQEKKLVKERGEERESSGKRNKKKNQTSIFHSLRENLIFVNLL